MKFKTEGITAILFFIIIFGMFIGLLTAHDNSPIDEFLIEYRTEVLPGTPVLDRLSSAVEIAEDMIYEKTFKKEEFNDIYGLVQKIIGKNIIADSGYVEIYRTKYNQIIFKVKKNEKNVKKSINAISELKNEMDDLGIPFLYIQAPFKLTETEQQLPINKIDYADTNVDLFLKGLDEKSVDYLDLRPLLRDGTKTQNQLFFNTDHHWRIETAFDATGHIIDKLNKDYGFNIDSKYKDINNYNLKTYKNCYLGSMGRRTGRFYSGLDDFTLITPNFKTNYTLYQYDYDVETIFEGSFEDAILVKEYINEKETLDSNMYAVYHGDNTELIFKNNLEDDGSILLIKDSFALPVYCFLSLGVEELRALDLRLFKESVVEYAKKNRPDVVIVMYNGDTFNGEMFTFS